MEIHYSLYQMGILLLNAIVAHPINEKKRDSVDR